MPFAWTMLPQLIKGVKTHAMQTGDPLAKCSRIFQDSN